MVVHRPDYSQLPTNRKVVILASGGRDSTAMVLKAWSIGISAVMVFNDTGLNRGGSKEVLHQLQELTGYELVTVKYEEDKQIKDILHNSFRQIPKVLQADRPVVMLYIYLTQKNGGHISFTKASPESW